MVQLQKRLDGWREREREMVGGWVVVVVVVRRDWQCAVKKSLGIGITMWDTESGDHLLHIPTCASSPHGLTCLGNQCLAASQIHRRGSVAGGVIFIWPCINKATIRSYPVEAIGPLASTKDGLYLVGGAPSGNAYVWEVSSGRLLRTWCAHHKSLTCLSFSSDDSFLISGSEDGTIVVWPMIGGSLTALVFCEAGLISASEDCTACLWDVVNYAIVRIFYHRRGPITNLVVIPQSSLLPRMNHHRATNRVRVSMLDKYPKPVDSTKGVLTFLSSHSSEGDHRIALEFQSTNLLKQQILDLEKGGTPAAIQMMAETSIESQACATRMTKHVMEMNKHLQSRLLDMMQCRLLQDPPDASSSCSAAIRKRKKTNFESLLLREEEQSQPESQGLACKLEFLF